MVVVDRVGIEGETVVVLKRSSSSSSLEGFVHSVVADGLHGADVVVLVVVVSVVVDSGFLLWVVDSSEGFFVVDFVVLSSDFFVDDFGFSVVVVFLVVVVVDLGRLVNLENLLGTSSLVELLGLILFRHSSQSGLNLQ